MILPKGWCCVVVLHVTQGTGPWISGDNSYRIPDLLDNLAIWIRVRTVEATKLIAVEYVDSAVFAAPHDEVRMRGCSSGVWKHDETRRSNVQVGSVQCLLVERREEIEDSQIGCSRQPYEGVSEVCAAVKIATVRIDRRSFTREPKSSPQTIGGYAEYR